MTDVQTRGTSTTRPAPRQRFRAAAEIAEGNDRLVLLTQVARALGLQERYDEAHALSTTSRSATTRSSSGSLSSAAGCSGPRVTPTPLDRTSTPPSRRAQAGFDALRVDAIHMQALVAAPEDRLALNYRALELASHSRDQVARDWDASLLNNIGMVHADAGTSPTRCRSFEQALAARERIGDPERTPGRPVDGGLGAAQPRPHRRRARDAARDQGRAGRGRPHRPPRRRRAGAPRGLTPGRKFCGSGCPQPDVYDANRSRSGGCPFPSGWRSSGGSR